MNYNVIKIFKGADHEVVRKLVKSSRDLSKSFVCLGLSSVIMIALIASTSNRVQKLENRVNELETRTDVVETDVKRIKTFNNSCNK